MGKRFAAAVAGLVLAILPAAGPAWAHEGKLKLDVAGDGATGVTVQARHADGHRLDSVVRLVLSATAEGGKSVGPVQLEPAGEGKGFYSSGPVLSPGTWKVTVKAPHPYTTAVTVEVKARAAQAAPPVAALPAAGESGPGVWRWWPPILAAVAIIAFVAIAGAVMRRRRASRT